VVYEAGPCGFVIWRHLNSQGIACEVVAPSSLPKRSGERVKTLDNVIGEPGVRQRMTGDLCA
jgi:hypothetical protein